MGNLLCIDFVNTSYNPDDAGGMLHSWDDLVDFLECAGAYDRFEARRLREIWMKKPLYRAKAFDHSLVLRDSLRMILSAIEGGNRIRPEWIDPINLILTANDGYEQLSPRNTDWHLVFIPRRGDPLQALMCIARSAADLITEGKGALVRKCANPNCILYFYDVSRTRRRRWCSMAVCGNRMKVAAYARRRKP